MTVDVNWTPVFDFKACGCTPTTLNVTVNVPQQYMAAVWPVDADNNPLPMPYALDIQSSAGTVFLPQRGFLLPTSLGIEVGSGLPDDAYAMTVTTFDPTDPVTEFGARTKVVLVDCAAKCCEATLAMLAQDRKCAREVMDDLTKVALWRKQALRLLECDNDLVGAKDMLDTIAGICRKYNCNC